MSHPYDHSTAQSYALDMGLQGCAGLYAVATDLPWVPLVTFVLIPGARALIDWLRDRGSRKRLEEENERLRQTVVGLKVLLEAKPEGGNATQGSA